MNRCCTRLHTIVCEAVSREGRRNVCGHMRAHGSGLCACETYSRLIVEEACGATEGDGIVTSIGLCACEAIQFCLLH